MRHPPSSNIPLVQAGWVVVRTGPYLTQGQRIHMRDMDRGGLCWRGKCAPLPHLFHFVFAFVNDESFFFLKTTTKATIDRSTGTRLRRFRVPAAFSSLKLNREDVWRGWADAIVKLRTAGKKHNGWRDSSPAHSRRAHILARHAAAHSVDHCVAVCVCVVLSLVGSGSAVVRALHHKHSNRSSIPVRGQ